MPRSAHDISGCEIQARSISRLRGRGQATFLIGTDGEFITDRDFLVDSGVTAVYWYADSLWSEGTANPRPEGIPKHEQKDQTENSCHARVDGSAINGSLIRNSRRTGSTAGAEQFVEADAHR